MVVDPSMLESVVRNHLNVSAKRTMVVLEPIKVNITNLVKGVYYGLDVPDLPENPEKGCHNIAFGSTIYIERSDFKEENEKGYRRLTPGQSVGLKYADHVLTFVKIRKGSGGKVYEIDVECAHVDKAEKPKAFIHWVADPIEVETRLYGMLFKHKNPEDPVEVPGGFLTDINPDSLTVLTAMADKSIRNAKMYDRFQFERNGFFSVDPDSDVTQKKLVFNRTVSLKEDLKKV
jgi:glutaminyl-tRNA synthetase